MRLDELDPDAAGPELDDPDQNLATGEPRLVMAYLEDLESLIDEEHVQYARITLEEIYETIQKTMKVTNAQMRAVGNIDEGGAAAPEREVLEVRRGQGLVRLR